MRIASVLIGLACFAMAAGGVMATTTVVHTTEGAFTAALAPGYYLEDFNRAPWTTLADDPISAQTFSGTGGWQYQISAPSGLSGQPMPNAGGAVANFYGGQGVVVTFTGTKKPTAVGGVFWVTNVNGGFLPGQTVTISLANGENYQYSDSSNWDAFTGFISISEIASMTIRSVSGEFATMDHLYVGAKAPPVPEPVTMISAFMGISALGMYIRKRTRVVA